MYRNFPEMCFKIISFFRRVRTPSEITDYTGGIILHIGDIPSYEFPYMKRLIKKVEPDIIIHTGDLVDDMKVSRLPEDIPLYKKYAEQLIKIMENSAEEVYFVPGNNDLEDFIKEKITKTQIIPPNSSVMIGNISFLLCHRVMDIDGDAKFYMYGHGPTGDTHLWEDNGRDGKYYSNAYFAPSIILTGEEKIIRLKGFKRRKSRK